MLEGKVALVTGGGRGIGRATALKLAEHGADVVVAARTEAEIRKVAKECTALERRRATAIRMDVTLPADWSRVVRQIVDELGRLDILVNNAGGGTRRPLLATTPEAFDAQLAQNLRSVFLGMKAVTPTMIEQGYGRIINLASLAGYQGVEGLAAYAAAKAGVINLTETMAMELRQAGHKGITCNAVCPGRTATRLYSELFPEDDLTSIMRPERVAEAVLLLSSEYAGGISRAKLDVRHY